jgi:hypothetical protein
MTDNIPTDEQICALWENYQTASQAETLAWNDPKNQVMLGHGSACQAWIDAHDATEAAWQLWLDAVKSLHTTLGIPLV